MAGNLPAMYLYACRCLLKLQVPSHVGKHRCAGAQGSRSPRPRQPRSAPRRRSQTSSGWRRTISYCVRQVMYRYTALNQRLYNNLKITLKRRYNAGSEVTTHPSIDRFCFENNQNKILIFNVRQFFPAIDSIVILRFINLIYILGSQFW